MMQLIASLTDVPDLAKHVEEGEERQKPQQDKQHGAHYLAPHIATIELHRGRRTKECTAIR